MARAAMRKYNYEKEIARSVKEHFDRTHMPSWHCVVGKNFGAHLTYESRHYVSFLIGEHTFVIYKYG